MFIKTAEGVYENLAYVQRYEVRKHDVSENNSPWAIFAVTSTGRIELPQRFDNCKQAEDFVEKTIAMYSVKKNLQA